MADERRGDEALVEWGDRGIGMFLIDGEDLRRLDFSRVMHHWDCG